MCAVIVNLGEGIYTRSQLKASSKGRPSIGILLLSNVALVTVIVHNMPHLSLLCEPRPLSSLCSSLMPPERRYERCHGLLQGLYLLAAGQSKAGLAVGTATSAALLLLDIKRAYDVGEAPVLEILHSAASNIMACQ